MSDNTPLGDRMKRYEHTFRSFLPRRSYTLMRLDGRAFHGYLKKAEKPFDSVFMEQMDLVAKRLCEEMMGVKLAYVQSDEISLLLTDFDTIQSEPWFGGNVSKLLSVPAALASAYLTRLRPAQPELAQFDCRVWSMADPVEVANYFVWRQRDAVRNSIQMVGQHYFTQSELHEKSGNDIQGMLFARKGINWDNFSPRCKRGRLLLHLPDKGWVPMGAPTFMAGPFSPLAELIPSLPSLHDVNI